MARRHKLRFKIIASSFVPTALILGAVAVLLLYSYQRVTETLVIERDRELTRLQAELLADDLADYDHLLLQVGGLITADTSIPPQEAMDLVAPLSRQLPFDGGLLLFDAGGTLVASSPARPTALGSSWLDREHIARCRQSVQPSYSDIVTDGPGGAEVIAVTVPLIGLDGQLQAILSGLFHANGATVSAFYSKMVRHIGDHTNPPEGASQRDEEDVAIDAGVPLDSFYRLLQRPDTLDLPLSTHARSYIVDGTGRLIYHPDLAQIGYRLRDQEPVQQLLAGDTGSIRTYDVGGQEIVASYAPIPDTPWGLVTEESWKSLIAPSQHYSRFLFTLLAVGLALPALVVTLAAGRITRPIEEVAAAAQQVAAGRFGQTIATDSHDEIAHLVQQFNSMSLQLGALYGQLERRVAERTRTLSEINRLAIETSRSLDAPIVVAAALERICQFANALRGAAYYLSADGGLELQATQGHECPWPAALAPEQAEPLLRGGNSDATWPVALTVCRPADNDAHWQVLPLVAKERPLGLMILVGAPPPEPETSRALMTMGHQVGLAIENARLYEQAHQVAILSERQRLARDLHDSVTQSLYGATLYASAANRLLAQGRGEQAQTILDDLERTTHEILKEMRLLIFELRPSVLQEQGIVAALRSRLDAVEGRASIATTLAVDGDPELSPAQEDAFYGIAQEALNNALRHAQASRIDVRLFRNDGATVLEIRDNGQGFQETESSNGLGLKGMQERAAEIGARLDISSAPGQGTRIQVEVAA